VFREVAAVPFLVLRPELPVLGSEDLRAAALSAVALAFPSG
jgi:hypothetical protein